MPEQDFEAELRSSWAKEDVEKEQQAQQAQQSQSADNPAGDTTKKPSAKRRRLRITDMHVEDRPRERLIRYGPSELANAELLAILIGAGDEDENALEKAHRLLKERGGLVGLLRSDLQEVMKISGVAEARATRIKAAVELAARGLADDEWPAREPFRSSRQVFERYRAKLGDLIQEEVWVLVLDQQHCLIREERLYKGMVHGASVRVAELLRPVIMHQGPAMIVVHNHPSGSPTPSQADRVMTRDLAEAAGTMGIELLDHVIVARADFASMSQLGMLGEQPLQYDQRAASESAPERYRA